MQARCIREEEKLKVGKEKKETEEEQKGLSNQVVLRRVDNQFMRREKELYI